MWLIPRLARLAAQDRAGHSNEGPYNRCVDRIEGLYRHSESYIRLCDAIVQNLKGCH
jgi:hypothetical protein